jgi:hypothetical protein
MTTTATILGTTVYGTPSGNYDGSSDQDWASDAAQAANYYLGRGSMQTITVDVTRFVGVITLEATLDADSDSATWFDTYTITAASALTNRQVNTVTGNFTWMRVHVREFVAGTINFVTITY